MLSWFRRQSPIKPYSTDPQELLDQSERSFTSLTCVVASLLARLGRPVAPEIVAGRTGDCFSLQFSPDDWALGMAGPARDLEEALNDLGLSARLAAGGAAGNVGARLMVVVRSSLSNNRSVLVCGGWPPLIAGERDWQWGLVHTHDERGTYLGDTMRDLLVHGQLGASVAWPHYIGEPSAVYRVDPLPVVTERPGRLSRRAMQRAVGLLHGDGARGGIPDLDRLVEWLHQGAPGAGRRCPYPYPKRAAIRCQFETQSRFLHASALAAPQRKSAAIHEVAELATGAARALAATEPPRLEPGAEDPRAIGPRAIGPRALWEPDAWDQLAARLTADADTREREAQLFIALRATMTQIADSLGSLTAD